MEEKRQMKKLLTVLCLLASVSGQAYAETEIDRLIATSQTISAKLKDGYHAAAGLSYYAGVGGIAPDGTVSSALITTTDLNNYNQALQDVTNAVYYNTQMLLKDKHVEAMVNLGAAIDTFVDASSQIAIAVEVAEVVKSVDQTNVEQKQGLQDYIATNDVEITQQEVNDYNSALGDVEDYAQQAAGFLAASRNESITESVDNSARSYNISIADTAVAFNAANQSISFYFNTNNSHGFYGFFSNDVKTQQEIMGIGQSIYTEQGTIN